MELDESRCLDLQWLGRPRCIGAWRVEDVLIACGPRTTLERLLEALEALGDWRPRALLLTHIHFDHAGAAGQLVERWPNLEVWVHRRGARHLVAPERLEASARRVFGDDFDRRFGPLRPIPEANVRPLDGGEVVHGFQTRYTPVHASHHLAYLHETGMAFVGDVAGIRLVADGPVMLPTPAPDIDLDAWAASVEAVADWRPTSLGLPHYGRIDNVAAHLDGVRDGLALQRELMQTGADVDAYTSAVRAALAIDDRRTIWEAYEAVVPPDQSFVGVQRWWELDQPG